MEKHLYSCFFAGGNTTKMSSCNTMQVFFYSSPVPKPLLEHYNQACTVVYLIELAQEMGGWKFRLGVQRKRYGERKKPEEPEVLRQCKVSLPLSAYVESEVQEIAVPAKRLLSLPPPASWLNWSIASSNPLILCKTEIAQASRVFNFLTLSIRNDLKWTLFVGGVELSMSKCPLLLLPWLALLLFGV